MNKILFILIIAICIIQCQSQVWEEWRAVYIGPGVGDYMRSMCIDDSCNVYVTGQSSNNINSSDYATVKYSSTGVQQWSARYEGVPNRGAIPWSIAADRFGNAYVTGVAPVGVNGPSKTTTIKYNQSGEQCWVRIFYGQYYQAAAIGYDIITDTDANVYITGTSYSTNTGADFTTLKYDSAGVQQWVAFYHGGFGHDESYYIILDVSGNVYVSGYSKGDTTNNDIAVVKYDPSGIQQWAARYNGPANRGDSATDLKVDNNGNVYVTGTSYGGTATGYDYVTIKYNSSGEQQWTARYNGNSNKNDIAHSLAVDNTGNVYVTGESFVWGKINYATVKYSPEGIEQWIKYYIYLDGADYGKYITVDNFGFIYVTGSSYGGVFGSRDDFATLKYSPAGEQIWEIRTSGSDGEVPFGLAVDTTGNVYVAGSNGRYLTIKYNQITGINPVSNEVPSVFQLHQNYPNPFNPATKIGFNIPPLEGGRGRMIKIAVYDILGKEIAILVNGFIAPGSYEAEWDGSNYPSGVYFYKLTAGSFNEARKMVLVK